MLFDATWFHFPGSQSSRYVILRVPGSPRFSSIYFAHSHAVSLSSAERRRSQVNQAEGNVPQIYPASTFCTNTRPSNLLRRCIVVVTRYSNALSRIISHITLWSEGRSPSRYYSQVQDCARAALVCTLPVNETNRILILEKLECGCSRYKTAQLRWEATHRFRMKGLTRTRAAFSDSATRQFIQVQLPGTYLRDLEHMLPY